MIIRKSPIIHVLQSIPSFQPTPPTGTKAPGTVVWIADLWCIHSSTSNQWPFGRDFDRNILCNLENRSLVSVLFEKLQSTFPVNNSDSFRRTYDFQGLLLIRGRIYRFSSSIKTFNNSVSADQRLKLVEILSHHSLTQHNFILEIVDTNNSRNQWFSVKKYKTENYWFSEILWDTQRSRMQSTNFHCFTKIHIDFAKQKNKVPDMNSLPSSYHWFSFNKTAKLKASIL